MAKEMLINTIEGQECRIAIVEDGNLQELYVERASRASQVGNIYKGWITNVEPSIQAAFVDFGGEKNGFLHVSDLHPQYFPKHRRQGGAKRKRTQWDRPPIQDCLRRGQEVVVQMTKAGIGTKGPTLTTYLSIPGRMLVMMPGLNRLGVSRKIEDEEARAKARRVLADLKLPPGVGFIFRTAGLDRTKREIQRDLNYLLRLWRAVEQRIKTSRAPAEIYQESDLVTRTIRDVYKTDIDRVICDRESVARKVKEFLNVAVLRSRSRVKLYTGKKGLFHEYGLEGKIEQIYSRQVDLPSGGSLVIDQTEALVAIDVNSGRFREHADAETTATKLNLEAAPEIARQLRLRDLGGVIIIDFIDMREMKNRRAVERALREAIKDDRARTKLLRMSAFGIVEMTRQRIRPSLKDSIYRTCRFCAGTGLVKSEESLSLLVIRDLQRACSHDDVARIEATVTPSVAHHLSNHYRAQIASLEQKTHTKILIHGDDELAGDDVRMTCTNNRGSVIAWADEKATVTDSRRIETVKVEDLPPAASRKPAAETAKPPAAEGKAAPAPEPQAAPEQKAAEAKKGKRKSKRRSRRGGKKAKKT